MSLVNLLSVGQSLQGRPDEASRYKLADPRVLPKFSPVGRPISLSPPLKVEVTEAGRYAAKQREEAEAAKQANAGALTRAKKPAWWVRMNPFHTPKRPNRPLIQTELLLESVRVVRNDLSDADLELVPMRAPQPVAMTPAKAGIPARILGGLKSRLSGLLGKRRQ